MALQMPPPAGLLAPAQRKHDLLQLPRVRPSRPQPHLFEITRDKRVVWEFADHEHFQTINQVQVLAIAGDDDAGEILR